jgi:hypothetical protein
MLHLNQNTHHFDPSFQAVDLIDHGTSDTLCSVVLPFSSPTFLNEKMTALCCGCTVGRALYHYLRSTYCKARSQESMTVGTRSYSTPNQAHHDQSETSGPNRPQEFLTGYTSRPIFTEYPARAFFTECTAQCVWCPKSHKCCPGDQTRG